MNKLGVSDRKKLMGRIGEILQDNSLGKSLAATIDEENYTFIHTEDVDPDAVGQQITEVARGAHEDGAMIDSRAHTLDADGAAMNEGQVAKALVYCMQKFCESDGNLKDNSLSDSLDAIMVDTVESVNYVKEASVTGAFELHYMPICDLRLGKVHHFEALTRFPDGNPGGPSPYHLISLAEEVGIIHDFDLAVAKKSIAQFKSMSSKEAMMPVAINVSGHSIENAYFVTALHQLLDANKDMAGRLLFEITESAKIENLGLVNEVVHGLRKKDYKVCLDDFGAGAASFDYLNSLDVDVVKFDGPVVRRAFESPKGRDLLSSMAKMCKKLGVESVAEMVEDKSMGETLYKLGIDFGQGWGYGKPTADPMEFAPHFAQRLMDRR
jgi:EAL domain-containing protein (putative c-di-GMP-specific phosphodiesterase class I)